MQANPYIHPTADVQTVHIGDGTRIWQYVIALPGAIVGRECNVCAYVFLENDVTVGNRVTIKSGVQLWDGIVIEDDVFIGPNVSFTNDKFPRSKIPRQSLPRIQIQQGASLGAGSVILPGVTIGRYAMVGAGAIVTSSVPSFAIVKGNPARITGYSYSNQKSSLPVSVSAPWNDAGFKLESTKESVASVIRGVNFHFFKQFEDLRGKLTALEFTHDLPFIPQRLFFTYDVPSLETRGEHAHRNCHQLLIAVSGTISVFVSNGREQSSVQLSSASHGLHIEPMVWASQSQYSKGACLVVLASQAYEDKDYIRTMDEYLMLINRKDLQPR
jgi:UDP-2-acetamido-3-amino-2,3-dideoxy-glucuronate N-acetyltransferase